MGIPLGNPIAASKFGSSTATHRARMANYPLVLVEPASMTAAQVAQLRSDAAAAGQPGIKVLCYCVVNDLSAANSTVLAAHKQLVIDNPQMVLKQSGPDGAPLVLTAAYGSLLQPALARSNVDAAGRTYMDAYFDIAWADFLGTTYDFDGAYIDEWISHLRCVSKWGTTAAGTVASGSTATNIKTSGFTVFAGAAWGRFKSDTVSAALRGVYFAIASATATDVPLQAGLALPAVPAAGDTFEVYLTYATVFGAGAGYTAYLADLFNDGGEHNEGSGRANAEVMYVQQRAVRRLKALAAAAGKPDFIVIANLGPGAGRYAYIKDLVADGMMHGLLYEGFAGKSYSPTPRASVNIAHELCNTFGDATTAYPFACGQAANETDWPAMRASYVLARMTNAWFCTSLNAGCAILDEYLVPAPLAEAIDPPQAAPTAGGYWLRRFARAAFVYNPTKDPIAGISLPGWKALDTSVAPFAGQDTTLNDGSGAAFTLAAMSGRVLVPA